jgi:protein SCO1/2
MPATRSQTPTPRRPFAAAAVRRAVVASLFALLAAAPQQAARADDSDAGMYASPAGRYAAGPLSQGPSGLTANSEIYKKTGIDQRLDNQVPLDLVFRDETGTQVKLDQYFHKGKPVVLALVYYECPMLCTMTLNGMVKTFKMVNLSIGKDYDVLTVSFDPREKPELAAKKKVNYVKEYKRDGADAGWHFMTGDEPAIAKLTDSVGFRYFYDTRTNQYGHSSAIIVLTPEGKVSRYFYGLEYAPKDVRLGLVEASQNKIGTIADSLVLLCYHYDPTTGKYGVAIMRTLRVAGVVTLVGLGGFIVFMFRRDRRLTIENAPIVAAATAARQPPAP